MPADALQAIDISRSDFMRRKVLFSGHAISILHQGRISFHLPCPWGAACACLWPQWLPPPPSCCSVFYIYLYFFWRASCVYTVRSRCVRKIQPLQHDAARFGVSNISIYLECPLTRSMDILAAAAFCAAIFYLFFCREV